MQKLSLVAVPFAALISLAAVGGSCSVSSTTWTINGFRSDQERHQIVLEEALELEAGEVVDVASPFGGIEVRVVDADYGVKATVTGFGESEEEAKSLAEAVKIAVVESGATHTLRAERKDGADLEQVGVSWVVRVPAGTGARAESSHGAVALHGALGDLDADSGFGSITVEGARGSLDLQTGSGSVKVYDVRGERAEIESGFGSLTVENSTFEVCALDTSSGGIEARNVTAESLEVDSGFGAVRLTDCRGNVDAETSSGGMRLERHEADRLRMHSGFGGIVAAGVFRGQVTLDSSSGSIELRAQQGSSMTDGWSLESGFGSVSAHVPEDMACDVSMETGFGKVVSSLPVKLSHGSMDGKDDEATGSLNGGGERLTMRSSSGSVNLRGL